MKIPIRLMPLVYANLIEGVVGQLQSGKEAEVYIVVAKGRHLCAKVYKDANSRTFRHKTKYTEGRKVRGSRRVRAMDSGSRYGREERENEWQNTEVDALVLLAASGVRVPQTYEYYEGVLLLEMITDEAGHPAPRFNDVNLTKEQALEHYQDLMRQVVYMLCAGIVHGDLSEFNVLLSKDGLVIIDLPQAVQATANNAYAIFERDILQLTAFFGSFAPEILATNYAGEIWHYYQNGKLQPNTPLTGQFSPKTKKADINNVLNEIDAAREEEEERHREPRDRPK